jgi:hypothetical protein
MRTHFATHVARSQCRASTLRKIISIDKVKKELLQNKDELSDWIIDNLPEDFFKDTSSVMTNYATLIGWVYSKSDQYSPTAISEFLDAEKYLLW